MTSSAPIAAIEWIDVTPVLLHYEADAMHAAVNGEKYGDTFHWQNWNDKPHRVVFDAVDLLRAAACEIEALVLQAEEMKREIAELREVLADVLNLAERPFANPGELEEIRRARSLTKGESDAQG